MNAFRFGLMLLFAFAGWQHARHLAKKYGRTPFNWPDWVWAVVCGLSLLIGIVLLAIAERGLRKAPGPVPQQAAYGANLAFGGQPAHGGNPVYGGNPAFGAWPPQPAPVQEPVAVAAAVPAAASALPPAGWAADPTGRHQLRWWDGTTWTSAVHDNGVQGTD